MTAARAITVIADTEAAAALGPLQDAWRRTGWDARIVDAGHFAGGVPDHDALLGLACEADAVLVIGPRARSPRTVLPAPVVTAGGRMVPVASLPRTNDADVASFAGAAARVHARSAAPTRTLAVLGERQPRFDRLAGRVAALAREGAGGRLRASRWTAYEVGRDELAARIGTGPAVAVYVGHGRPIGWVGYAGLRAHHLSPAELVSAEPVSAEPAAAILSLTCKTASRRRTGLSFAEALPLRGISAAAVGAVGPTRHTVNARWAVRLARTAATAATVGDLIAAVCVGEPAAADYRLLGDPTAPLRDAPACAADVPAYAAVPSSAVAGDAPESLREAS